LGGNLHTTKKIAELLLVPIKESGPDIKLSTWSRFEIRMQGIFTSPLKGWNSSIDGNSTDESKFSSGRN
jgi:hypothetical protein